MGARNAFALSQLFILVVIVGALYFYSRRSKSSGAGISDADLARARARITELMKNEENPGRVSRNVAPSRAAPSSSPALTSALPSWNASTPPHVVLGIPSDAKAQVVDMAYRALVKKYHPDRFSSWGPEYMDRAHEITILLQKARDMLMKTNS